MMECKKALETADGNIELAIEAMRKSGQARADKRAGRVAAEGLIGIQTSHDNQAAAVVEVNCETDFVAKGNDFKEFVDKVTRRVLEENPADLDALLSLSSGPEGGSSLEETRKELIAKIGENISVRRFIRDENAEGRIGAYLHGGRIGVLVSMKGGNEVVAKDVAMHVAASRPLCVGESDIPSDMMEKEREILRAQSSNSGKPPEIVEKMVAGRLKKFVQEVTLLGQPFVKNPDVTVEKYLSESGAEVVSFTRFEVGEGIEKKTEDFAQEVMAQVRGAKGA